MRKHSGDYLRKNLKKKKSNLPSIPVSEQISKETPALQVRVNRKRKKKARKTRVNRKRKTPPPQEVTPPLAKKIRLRDKKPELEYFSPRSKKRALNKTESPDRKLKRRRRK